MSHQKSHTIRRSVALPEQLVEEALRAAPRELGANLNRLVMVSLQEYVERRKAAAFAAAMAEMACDPAIRNECASIAAGLADAELDGLKHD